MPELVKSAAPLEMERVPVSPMQLIERASAAGASIETMQQLFDLKLRVDLEDGKRAFNMAFSRFKSEAISVVKNVTVSDGPLKGKKYADLFGVVSTITPLLSKYDLSHSWRLTKDEPGWMEVTCTIRHSLGHSESVSMGAAPDTGPGRNAIQARGSAKSYLERYTLLAATGMAASDTDDDGRATSAPAPSGPQPQPMPEEEVVAHLDNIAAAANVDELKKIYVAAVVAAERAGDLGSKRQFILAKDKAKKGLS